jgi:uncharacterized protein
MTAPEKESNLLDFLRSQPSLLVAYSGGVDSAYLLHAAVLALGTRARGVIADSPSLPRRELAEAVELARQRNWPLEVIQTRELDNPAYAANPVNRCYFCKHELFACMEAHARLRGETRLAYGENADDAHDFRPGQEAAREFRVLAPLREARLTKAEIRSLSASAGLPTAGKAAQPCLSSRLPTGQPVTREALRKIEAGENLLRNAGFRIYRLRHLGEKARIQVAPDEKPRLDEPSLRLDLEKELKALGFSSVEFDSEGYRGASLR